MNAASMYTDAGANKKLQQDTAGKTRAFNSTWFIIICSCVFIASVAVTAFFCITMNDSMPMPGVWRMSMMWMRMPGETWLSSFAGFMLMWLAMMIVMMLPSALPMFLKTKKRLNFLCFTSSGYFITWLLAGVVFYIPGVMLANAAMHSESFSNLVPLLFGLTCILTGAYQFTRLKMMNLLHCRSATGCNISMPGNKTGFGLGCKQGITCCTCSSGLMIMQLVLGVMNPVVMVAIALAVAIEKLLPYPVIAVRLFGLTSIIIGVSFTTHWFLY